VTLVDEVELTLAVVEDVIDAVPVELKLTDDEELWLIEEVGVTLGVIDGVSEFEADGVRLAVEVVENAGRARYWIQEGPAEIVEGFTSIH